MISVPFSCKCYQVLLECCFELLQTWVAGARGAGEGKPGSSAGSPQQQQGQGQQQQQEQQCKGQLREQHLVVDSLRWALLSGAYALVDVVDERVWLALHLYKKLLCWEEVQEQVVVVAAGACKLEAELARSYLTYMAVGSTLAYRDSSSALDESQKAALAITPLIAATDLVTRVWYEQHSGVDPEASSTFAWEKGQQGRIAVP